MSDGCESNAFPAYLALGPHDLGFTRYQSLRTGSGGCLFPVWEPRGMPRINDQFLECVFYLYPSREAAEIGEQIGGTGFVAGVPSDVHEGVIYGYAVTNRHVAVDDGASCIRVNRCDGSVEVLEFDPAEWLVHPSGDDLAVIPLGGMVPGIHDVRLFDTSWFVTEESSNKLDIGPGDDVFMVGRFVHHDGKKRNQPSVRFGNISMNASLIRQSRRGFEQLSYGVEMRSMGGYSGSPVFVCKSPWDMNRPTVTVAPNRVKFLGVNWGYITDKLEVDEEVIRDNQASQSEIRRRKQYVKANTGMNGVIPAWKVKELLDMPMLSEQRKHQDLIQVAIRAQQRADTKMD
ncbi:MAG: serine protease [Alphaproteobacteria bacterium]